jgi:hypothetical protein
LQVIFPSRCGSPFFNLPHEGLGRLELGEALDTVRKSEFGRLRAPTGADQGQKYTLLSRRENLTLDGKKALKSLRAANKRQNRLVKLATSGAISPKV